ncbi:MAG TPA: hypothetical protein VI564_00255 [Candidatus Nanoarchaeia archaeon]|nr:hypothetical protein [Candidatus Nanoarchaeia archaeon]
MPLMYGCEGVTGVAPCGEVASSTCFSAHFEDGGSFLLEKHERKN